MATGSLVGICTTPNDASPREREYVRQINDLKAKVVRQQEHFEGEVARMRNTRTVFVLSDDSVTKREEVRAECMSRARDAVAEEVDSLRLQNEMLEARISAGIYRRTLLFHIACIVLRCEDDTTLTDDQHDALMDEAIRHARTVVSLERLARQEDRKRKAENEAAEEGE